MTTKLKIDLSEGILEVEGSETFVTAIYNDFKAHFIGQEAVDDLYRSTRAKRPKTTKATKPKALPAKQVPPKKEPEPTPKVQTQEPVTEPEPAAKPAAKPVTKPAAEPAAKPAAEPAAKPAPPKPIYTFLEDLDLSAANNGPSLVEFMDAKLPITNEERNLVFVHYLQTVRKIKRITIDHIYTCYKAAKIRVPINIEKSLHMAANWINISKTGRLTVSAAGKRYVEKQLPKKLKN